MRFPTEKKSEIIGLAALIAALLFSGIILVAAQTYRELHPAHEVTWEKHLSQM